MKGTHLASLCLSVLLPSLASATVVWKGDFESGDLSQYTSSQRVAADRLQVVQDEVTQGRYALKATVVQGDNPNGASGNRNELVKVTSDPEGSEYYYSWSTYFPADYPSVASWQVFAQWHQSGCCGSPPIDFYTFGDEIRMDLGANGTYWGFTAWRTPLVRGKWLKFTAHIHWSTDASKGWIEVYYGGKLALQRTYGFTGADTFLKLGLYRDASVWQTESIYQDGMVKADTLADVEGNTTLAPAPVVDGGVTPAENEPAVEPAPAATDAGTVPSVASHPTVTAIAPDANGQVTGCSASGSGLAGIFAVMLVAQVLRRRRA